MNGGMGTLIFPLLVGGAMLFFMSRTQKKQQAQRQDLLNAMDIGSKVVTIGGLHGTIAEINQEKSTVLLDCEGIFLEFNRSAIASVKPGEVVVNDATTTAVEVEEEATETEEK